MIDSWQSYIARRWSDDMTDCCDCTLLARGCSTGTALEELEKKHWSRLLT